MKTRLIGYTLGDGRQKSAPIIERALQLNDETLTKLMLDAGWIQPLDVTIDPEDPASVKRAKLRGIEVNDGACDGT